MGFDAALFAPNNAVTSTFGLAPYVTPGLSSGERAAPPPRRRQPQPRSADAGCNVAATSRRLTRNVGGAGRNIFVNIKGARSGHGTVP